MEVDKGCNDTDHAVKSDDLFIVHIVTVRNVHTPSDQQDSACKDRPYDRAVVQMLFFSDDQAKHNSDAADRDTVCERKENTHQTGFIAYIESQRDHSQHLNDDCEDHNDENTVDIESVKIFSQFTADLWQQKFSEKTVLQSFHNVISLNR